MAPRPMRVLNVAEKPSVAREVTRILNNGQQAQSRIVQGAQYNPVYSFPFTLCGQPCDMHFTSVAGHLLSHDFVPAFKKWHSCPEGDLITKADLCVQVRDNNAGLQAMLQEEARSADWLLLWLDCDREGEAICEEVMHVCRAVKGNLVIKRPRFSALTPADITRAVGPALGVPDANAAAAVSLRQEIDLRLGAAFTRWQTRAVQDAFEWSCPGVYDFTKEDGKSPLISYGPCQFPTLGFIVQRAWERASHVVEPFWVIEMAHAEGSATAQFTWKRQRVFDQVLAALLYRQCCASGAPPTAVITTAQGSSTYHGAPVPLATLGLQTRACRALRCSPEKVMAAAESLYQSGFISYPRTETDKFPPDLDLRPLVEEQRQEPRWGQYATELVTVAGRMRVPRDGGHSDGAHPPIYPTKCPTQQQYTAWSREQKGVYDLVARHFLACVSLDAVGHQTVVVATLAGEEFTTRGLSISDHGFLRIYGKGPPMPGGNENDVAYDSWGGNANLPPYTAGTSFVPTRLLLQQRQTQAPGLVTEAELLTLMDRHGIGTDATQASHIEKVCGGRGYAQRHGDGTVAPTQLGEALVAGYQAMGMGRLWEPNLRAAMERDCAEVAAGRLNKDAALTRWLSSMRQEFDAAEGQCGQPGHWSKDCKNR